MSKKIGEDDQANKMRPKGRKLCAKIKNNKKLLRLFFDMVNVVLHILPKPFCRLWRHCCMGGLFIYVHSRGLFNKSHVVTWSGHRGHDGSFGFSQRLACYLIRALGQDMLCRFRLQAMKIIEILLGTIGNMAFTPCLKPWLWPSTALSATPRTTFPGDAAVPAFNPAHSAKTLAPQMTQILHNHLPDCQKINL